MESESKPNRTRFTKEDDDRLRQFTREFGCNWKLISEKMGDKSVRQCRERYQNYLNPNLNISEWTAEEEAFLLAKVNAIGTKWALIAPLFNHRSEVNIKNHYARMRSQVEKKMRKAAAFPFVYPIYQPEQQYFQTPQIAIPTSGQTQSKEETTVSAHYANYAFDESFFDQSEANFFSDVWGDDKSSGVEPQSSFVF